MFDYLAVLLSVILGLALTHLLSGASRLIQLRHSVKLYWVQLVWTLNVIIYVLALWWGMFWWKHLTVWTIQEFFFLTGYAIVLFVVASMLFPHDCHEGLDCEAHFYRNRTWFFGLQLVALLCDVPETVIKSYDNLRAVPHEYLMFMPIMIGIAIVGLVARDRRIHGALCLSWLGVIVSYLTFTSLDRISAA
ncbi:MAG TPA: hypothetical protein VNT42_11890 [Sphingomonas sp.]|nr:hypothetical protein [Sphingomonas sp.]